MPVYRVLLAVLSLFQSFFSFSQIKAVQQSPKLKTEAEMGMDTSSTDLTLAECLRFAVKNQPALKQALIDEAVSRLNSNIALSGWMPQVSASANYQNYFQLPTSFSTINGKLTGLQSGVYNYSIPSVAATQTLFNTDAVLALRASRLNSEQTKLLTTGTRIELVAGVSKAFYDLLLSVQQIGVYKDDTARLKKNLSDALNRYKSGIADKVDYKQATITLNNSMSQLKTATEAVQAKYATLKQLMGYPAEKKFTVRFDTASMMQEIYLDTNARLQFEKRIEFQQMELIKRIQHETTNYYKLGFLPSLSAYYNYFYEFESNRFSDLYTTAYPYSLAGIQLSIPIFSGFKRTENVHKARLQEERTDWDEINLKLVIFTQYKQALASYKSNLYYLQTQRENVDLAREVYNIVKLQYREGVKAYLDVIVAESDLQTSEINYLNALFHLLESKIDLEQALGDIPVLN